MGSDFSSILASKTPQENDYKNIDFFNPFLMDFGSLWGSTLRPFSPPKINEKPSLLQGPLQGRPIDVKRLQNDAKWSSTDSKMEQKWNQKWSEPAANQGDKDQKTNKLWIQLWIPKWALQSVSENMAAQVSL